MKTNVSECNDDLENVENGRKLDHDKSGGFELGSLGMVSEYVVLKAKLARTYSRSSFNYIRRVHSTIIEANMASNVVTASFMLMEFKVRLFNLRCTQRVTEIIAGLINFQMDR